MAITLNAGYTISQTHVDEFAAGVIHEAQQKQSQLLPLFPEKDFIKGDSHIYSLTGKTGTIEIVNRHQRVEESDPTYKNRMLFVDSWYSQVMLDKKDDITSKIGLQGSETTKIAAAFARRYDQGFLYGLMGPAWENIREEAKWGQSSKKIAFPKSQRIFLLNENNAFAITADKEQSFLRAAAAAEAKFQANHEYSGELYSFLTPTMKYLLGINTKYLHGDWNRVQGNDMALPVRRIIPFAGINWIVMDDVANIPEVVKSEATAADLKFDTNTGLYSSSGTALNATNISNAEVVPIFNRDALKVAMHEAETIEVRDKGEYVNSRQIVATASLGVGRKLDTCVMQLWVPSMAVFKKQDLMFSGR